MRDGSDGLPVWAVGTLVGALMLAGGIMGTAQTAGTAAGAAAGIVAEEGPDAFTGYLTDTLFSRRAARDLSGSAAQP